MNRKHIKELKDTGKIKRLVLNEASLLSILNEGKSTYFPDNYIVTDVHCNSQTKEFSLTIYENNFNIVEGGSTIPEITLNITGENK